MIQRKKGRGISARTGIREEEAVMPSGLRIYLQQISSTQAVHCGLIMDTGSRDERQGEEGMAHFIEHMIFKGTRRRKTFHILNAVESAGGELNAYTTKEKTAVYASLEASELDRAVDVLSDIVFHPSFPARELKKEQQVVSEEIDMYRDSPEEAILEDFDQLVFPSHPLGHPILGTRKSVARFSQDRIRAFHKRNYVPSNIVLSVSGNVTMEQVLKAAEKHFADLHSAKRPKRVHTRAHRGPAEQDVEIAGTQAHCVLGGKAYPLRKGKFVAFHLINNYLGGTAGISRLNMEIRENRGLCYNIYSFYQPYLDQGMWGVYYACDPKNAQRIRDLVAAELRRFKKKKPGTSLLNRIKRQAAGQLVLSNEYPQTLMLAAGKNLLDFNRNFSLEELLEAVDSISDSDLMEAANEIFDEKKYQFLFYKPEAKE